MANGSTAIAPYSDLLKSGGWTLAAILVWIVLSLFPSVRENQVFFAWMNVVMLLCVLPTVLLLIGVGHFAMKAKYVGSSACLLVAIIIAEVLNLIPFNPFALGLPFCLMCQGQNFSALGHFKAAELCARRLMAFWGADKPAHSQWQLSALTCLAEALQGQGRYDEASKVLEPMFKMVESNDVCDELQAAALSDFAGNLSKLGRAKEAIQMANKALTILNSMPNGAKEQLSLLSIAMSQLGIAHECAGEYQLALQWYRKGLAAKIEMHGDDALETATGLNNVGYALTECGQLEEASEKLEKARQILAKLGLQDTNSWAHVIENLGDLHRAMGKFDEAESELLESLQLRKKRFKEDLHHTYHDLGKLYRDKQDWKNAQTYFEKALSAREKRFAAPTAQTLKEFAKLMQAMEKNAEATTMQQRAEELLAKTS